LTRRPRQLHPGVEHAGGRSKYRDLVTDAEQRTAGARVPPAPRWITRPVSIAVIAVAAVGVALSLHGVPAAAAAPVSV